MVQIFKSTNIDFIGKRRKFFFISALMLLLTVSVFIYRGGPNYGIDFTGGILIQASFQQEVELQDVRSALERNNIGSFELQSSGNVIMIRAKKDVASQKEFENATKVAMQETFPNNSMAIDRVEYVGPSVGAYLSKQALYAFFFAFIGIIVYVAFRFKSGLWGVGAVLGIIHDVVISFGFVILANKEVNITVIAALLTVAGYSINDTIVLFDRIKENLRLLAKEDFGKVINRSINEVLTRTVVTSLTVFIVASSLFFFGGEVIHTFSYIMLIGTILGVFSTLFICTPIVYEWEQRKKNRLKVALKKGYVSSK
ncbi:MAG: protein translocase subunit SecF [Endomicrobium sp.]|jgi:preprotein translocase subunit SecF|nr:protein translocase subunit SecF [Endomicrobium sp.]